MKKKISKVLVICMTVLCLLGAAAGVSADLYVEDKVLTPEEAQQYAQETQIDYILSVMLSENGEMVIPSLEKSQDYFYEKIASQVKESYQDLGAYQETESVNGEIKDDILTLTTDIRCANMDAEVITTYRIKPYVDSSSGQLKNEFTPLDFTLNPGYPVSVNMANAGRNTAIGLITVFIILAFLSFVIGLLKFLNPENRKKKVSEKPVSSSKEAIPAKTPEPAPVLAAGSSEEEIAAVIAAAIAAAQNESQDNSTYVVSSIRRVAGDKRWKRA